MEVSHIKVLVEKLSRSHVDELEFRSGEILLALKKQSTAQFAGQTVDNGDILSVELKESAAKAVEYIKSDYIGNFELAHPQQDYESVQVGESIAVGDIVCLIRNDEFLSVVRAPRAGRLGRQLKETGAAVGFGDALFEIN